MARYIDAEPLPNGQFWDNCTDTEKAKILSWILGQPTADVVEVKHGCWQQNQYHKNIYYCSECGRHIEDGSNNPLEHFPYCHCGAKMDLEVEK